MAARSVTLKPGDWSLLRREFDDKNTWKVTPVERSWDLGQPRRIGIWPHCKLDVDKVAYGAVLHLETEDTRYLGIFEGVGEMFNGLRSIQVRPTGELDIYRDETADIPLEFDLEADRPREQPVHRSVQDRERKVPRVRKDTRRDQARRSPPQREDPSRQELIDRLLAMPGSTFRDFKL